VTAEPRPPPPPPPPGVPGARRAFFGPADRGASAPPRARLAWPLAAAGVAVGVRATGPLRPLVEGASLAAAAVGSTAAGAARSPLALRAAFSAASARCAAAATRCGGAKAGTDASLRNEEGDGENGEARERLLAGPPPEVLRAAAQRSGRHTPAAPTHRGAPPPSPDLL